MAMIQCPQCGGTISDKAVKCIHCGLVLKEESKKFCPECGAEISPGATICDKCGCPVEPEKQGEESPQKVEVTSVKLKAPGINKKALGIVAAVILVIIAGAFGLKYSNEQKAIKQAEEASKKYREDLETISLSMLSGAVTAETCGNLMKKVWSNAIYEKADYETDKYTKENGRFVDDFNDALLNLYIDNDYSKKIESIESNQESVAQSMKDMKNPPDDWKDAYDDLKSLYDAYIKLTNMAVNPTGSLQTFSNDFNSADTAFSTEWGKMKLYFD